MMHGLTKIMLIQHYQNRIKTAIFGPVNSDVLAVVNFKSAIFWCVCVFVTPCSLQNFTGVAYKPVERQNILLFMYISNQRKYQVHSSL